MIFVSASLLLRGRGLRSHDGTGTPFKHPADQSDLRLATK
jgi:hypothetical protein